MKKLILILVLFCFANKVSAYTFDQYSGVSSQGQLTVNNNSYSQTTKVYNNRGEYQGRFEKKGDVTKSYNAKGVYQYSFVQSIPR